MNQKLLIQQIKKVFAGELIFSEGTRGAPCMFIIKEGHVEIFITRDDKRIILSKLGNGACFGEMALISTELRNASAKALTYCELYMIDRASLNQSVESSPPLIRHIVKSLIGRVRSMVNVVALHTHGQTVLVSYAQLLELMAGQYQSDTSVRKGEKSVETSIPLKAVVEKSRALFGNSKNRSRAILKFMDSLHLIREEFENSNVQAVHFFASDIVDRAQKIPDVTLQGLDDLLQSDLELVEIDELAQIVGVDRKLLLAKLATDELADELFAFRKSSALRLFAEKGRDYFRVRTPKKPGEIADLEDLDVVDQNTLFEVVNQFDISEIALMLKVYDSENVMQKISGAMSKAKQLELRQACDGLQEANPLQADQIKSRLMTSVRKSLGAYAETLTVPSSF